MRIPKAFLVAIVVVSLFGHVVNADENSRFYITGVMPKEVVPGDLKILNIAIKNLGTGVAYYVSTDIVLNKSIPIKIVGETKRYHGTLKEPEQTAYFGSVAQNEEVILQYQIYVDKNTESGVYYIPLQVIWKTEANIERRELLNFGIKVNADENADFIIKNLSDKVFLPFESKDIQLVLKNAGTGSAKLVGVEVITKESGYVKVVGVAKKFYELIKPGEEIYLSYSLKVEKNTPTGTYIVPLVIRWKTESDVYKNETLSIPITVVGKADLSIAAVTSNPAKISAGDTVQLTIRVENTGSIAADSVKVSINLPFKGGKTAYLGQIKPDDDAPAIFTILAENDGEYDYAIEILYKDDSGEHKIVERSKLTVFQRGSPPIDFKKDISPRTIGTVIGVIAVSLVFFSAAEKFFRRRNDERH